MRAWLGALATTVLLLSGCGGDQADEAGAEGESLQEFLGIGGGDPEAMAAEFEEQQREIEERIAECMAAQGFEYVPRDHSSSQQMVAHPRQDLSEEEFREEYGFGISTVDREHVQAEAIDAADLDPNHEIAERMDEAERQAYYEALDGEPPEIDPDDPDQAVMWEPDGCRGDAEREVRGASRLLQAELGDELSAMYERLQSDPRIVEAEEGWAACLREAGWDFGDRNELYQHISDQFNELLADARPEPLPELEPGDEPAEDFEPPPPTQPDEAALAELQEEELELAAVDWECTVEHIGEGYEVYLEVQREYEAEFVEEHRDVLEDIRDR